ncbi:Uncharacterized protein BM_BM1531 [Brugia malayi]|uniref:Bm1531 n=1 Tax=Brugia malayi TaxID=6279 RepID=A0A0J9Y2Y1_BRUMA|nr:Uncharacterized protein BM_BM1531 [Brugia malayi]CDQ01276.1 Bm1531 [Brugia malayi]VIP00300.1 Uncharacterized protein BM_BM1531 [Brugia malayi]
MDYRKMMMEKFRKMVQLTQSNWIIDAKDYVKKRYAVQH